MIQNHFWNQQISRDFLFHRNLRSPVEQMSTSITWLRCYILNISMHELRLLLAEHLYFDHMMFNFDLGDKSYSFWNPDVGTKWKNNPLPGTYFVNPCLAQYSCIFYSNMEQRAQIINIVHNINKINIKQITTTVCRILVCAKGKSWTKLAEKLLAIEQPFSYFTLNAFQNFSSNFS